MIRNNSWSGVDNYCLHGKHPILALSLCQVTDYQLDFIRAIRVFTTHKTAKTFLKKSLWKSLPTDKTVEKSLQLWQKIVVCMVDNCVFCIFMCRVRGPLEFLEAYVKPYQIVEFVVWLYVCVVNSPFFYHSSWYRWRLLSQVLQYSR